MFKIDHQRFCICVYLVGLTYGWSTVRDRKCPSGYCPSGNCLSGICHRGSVRRAIVQSGYCPRTPTSIDDCFFIFTHGQDKIHEVLTFMNAIHPTIKFNLKYPKTSIDFLDTSIHIVQGGKLFSKVYTKPTDTFPLLDFKSNHPVETKLWIIYSQARRYRLLTTYDEDLIKCLSRLKLILLVREYPNHIINFKFIEATTLSQKDLLSTHSHNKKNNTPPLPFVIPYHWENRHIKKLLKETVTS